MNNYWKRQQKMHATYWQKREAEALKNYIKDEAEYDKQIKAIYNSQLNAIDSLINEFYGRYASSEGITIAEAKKRVSKLEIERYEKKAEKYVAERNFSKRANEEMRLYNATMKINRLEMLKANIGLELIAGHDELDKFMAGILKDRTEEELERQAGILGKTIKNNAALANAIPNASFHNAKFSDRVWQYQELLKNDLSKALQTGLIQGKNPKTLTKDIKKYFIGADGQGGINYAVERLMRTELARVQTEAQKQSFEKNGFSKYMFIVNGGCCPICEEVKNKKTKYGYGVYLVDKMMPGLNAPPMHPHCRCSIAAYEADDEYNAWLEYLNAGGTTKEWNKLADKSKWFDIAKSNKAYQDEIKRRREEWHARQNAKTENDNEAQPKKKAANTIESANAEGVDIIGKAYEKHRKKNGLNMTTFEQYKESSVKYGNKIVDYDKLSVETASMFNKVIGKLAKEYDTSLQVVRTMTKDEAMFNNAFASVRHNYEVSSAELLINPVKMKDLNKVVEKVMKQSQKGFSAKIPESAAAEYIATHEFAHTLLHMTDPLNKNRNWVNADYAKVEKARKEINAVYERYMKEVETLTEEGKKNEFDFMMNMDMEAAARAKNAYDKLETVKISNYSLENVDEFLAESFANEKLGVQSNPYAKEVVEILDKHFKG